LDGATYTIGAIGVGWASASTHAWIVWTLSPPLLSVFGWRHPHVGRRRSTARLGLALLALVVFVLCFTRRKSTSI
jgi:hypothetical protein